MNLKLLCTATMLSLGLTAASASALPAAGSVPDPWARPTQVPAPADNPPTPARVELGKDLFFDPRLSGSNWISCASCHNPSLGWSDGLATGFGHDMKPLPRRTPTILNAAYNTLQMWDGRKKDLEDQALGPIGAAGEMNQDIAGMVAELKAIPAYGRRFEAAYPGEGINERTIAKAIASFERTIVSGEAPFDRWRRGDERAVSTSAKRGFALFTGKADCALCHSGGTFTDGGFHNIGLKSEDVGRYAQKPVKVLKGAFKTPGLRDVMSCAPYMHNGMYRTLEEVVEHYDRGGDVKDNLDPNMRPLHLSAAEKTDLVEFLKSLSGAPLQVTLPQLPR